MRAAGISTTTFVDLIEATARTPGSRPSSSAASRLISETTRCGPHCMLDLGHDRVAGNPRHDADQPVAGRGLANRPAARSVGEGGREPSEFGAVDRESPGLVGGRRELARLGPSSGGVVADAEQLRGIADSVAGHAFERTRMCG